MFLKEHRLKDFMDNFEQNYWTPERIKYFRERINSKKGGFTLEVWYCLIENLLQIKDCNGVISPYMVKKVSEILNDNFKLKIALINKNYEKS